ncbi:MAG: 3'-5' exonuclease [Gemmatimonadaceae bacterium]
MQPSELLGHVLSLPGAPPRVAARIADSLFSRHSDFARSSSGEWSLLVPSLAAVDLADTVSVSQLRYAVVDVEATGTSSRLGDRITEVAVVPVDAGVVGEPFVALVNPERPIPPSVVALTRITWEMVRSAPRFTEIAGLVVEQLKGRVFVAHNATFDWRFVLAELARADGTRLEGDQLCTVRLARVLLPQLRRRTLDALARYFGVEITQRHRAGPDALATAKILCRLLDLAHEHGLGAWPALSACIDRRTGRARRKRSAMPRPVDFDPSL